MTGNDKGTETTLHVHKYIMAPYKYIFAFPTLQNFQTCNRYIHMYTCMHFGEEESS